MITQRLAIAVESLRMASLVIQGCNQLEVKNVLNSLTESHILSVTR